MSEHADTIRAERDALKDDARGSSAEIERTTLAMYRAERRAEQAEAALLAFETIALNGSVCTPPDSSFVGGPALDIDAMKCAECKEAWQLLRAALASGGEGDTDG